MLSNQEWSVPNLTDAAVDLTTTASAAYKAEVIILVKDYDLVCKPDYFTRFMPTVHLALHLLER